MNDLLERPVELERAEEAVPAVERSPILEADVLLSARDADVLLAADAREAEEDRCVDPLPRLVTLERRPSAPPSSLAAGERPRADLAARRFLCDDISPVVLLSASAHSVLLE